ncbi:hypothetical protein EON64_00615 [archaeon]|nr:MAG: hypothetical protein EON64_00615 [archaeon]
MASSYAQGLSQQDLMIKDQCIVVDDTDRIIGHGSKLDVHTVTESTPRGNLHPMCCRQGTSSSSPACTTTPETR